MVNWLFGWLYRTSKVVNGSTAGAQTNYQMKITLHAGFGTDDATNMYLGNLGAFTDFRDIRFTDSTGTTLLSYWLDPSTLVAGVSVDAWVQIASIPASPSTTTIYLYYGNASATSASNGTNTFAFFDDFNSLNAWTVLNGGGTGSASATTYLGQSVAALVVANGSNRVSIVSPFNSSNNMILEARLNCASISDGGKIAFGNGSMVSASESAPVNGYYSELDSNGNTKADLGLVVSSTITILNRISNSLSNGVWYIEGLSWIGSSLKTYQDGTNKNSATDSTYSTQTYIHLTSDNGTWNYDWVRVRNISSPEPTFGASGTTETQLPIMVFSAMTFTMH
jgi:hypothetical protein